MRPVPRAPFVITTFVGSFLLFQVQPMVARMALPDLGGAPAVWNSAMLVYQALLLCRIRVGALAPAGFPVRRQVLAHLALLLAALPVAPDRPGVVRGRPPATAWCCSSRCCCSISVGPVLLAVSAQAPLVQQWFASGRGANPYPLYAASNLGSFTGLLAYPLLVEPLAPPGHPALGMDRGGTPCSCCWSVAAAFSPCAPWPWAAPPHRAPPPSPGPDPPPLARRSVATWTSCPRCRPASCCRPRPT